MKVVTQIFYVLGMISILGLIGMFLLGIYWQWVPYNIEKIYDQNQLPLVSNVLKGGDVIRWRAHYIMYISGIRVEYKYTLEPAKEQGACDFRILQEGSSITRLGEVDHISAMVRVPLDFQPCIYHVHILTTFHPNPSKNRVIYIESQTEDFQVI